MDHQDRQAIEQLFGKLAQVESQSAAPDAQAAEFIRSRIGQQPNAPYYMAQTIVVQEQALSVAHGRIQQLEQELASRPASGGGFLSGLFGGAQTRPQPHQPYQPQPMQGLPPHMAPGMVLVWEAWLPLVAAASWLVQPRRPWASPVACSSAT